MSTYRRNVAVGVTVLAALIMLGWMILRFGANIAKPFAGEMIPVKFVTDRADGVSDGSNVIFRGVVVGRVLKVWRDSDMKQVWAEAEVDAQPPLPAKLSAGIIQSSLLGSGANLIVEADADSQGNLVAGTTIPAHFVGLNLVPPELSAIAKQLKDENFVGNLNGRVTQAAKLIDEAQQTLAGLNKVVNDEKFRQDLQASMANIRAASESAKAVTAKADAIASNVDSTVNTVNTTAKSAQAKLDEISKSIQARLDQTAATLEAVAGITKKINDGSGTAGKLVNDPKLYAGLVSTTDELNAAVKDLRRLIQQWEQEGVTAKLR
ncbi:MAG: MlaD family protein [Tepidisphaeraceae bacterium]